ncbi:MAG: phosphoenolpyruvate carboxylase, partial [Candidatus Hadarchaeum sp.]|uniref:phosphoenolpyruvate carboxylase n=1 Tax=Candidatus Hadarchaeum sp. TaxID=2883567 RepID=UPI00317B478D
MSLARLIVPRTMSTQHPDNARLPPFSSGDVMGGEDEILEIYWVFSQLNCQEQMWDFEGKKALPWVVSELLMKNQEFFRERFLGKDFFLTFRIPNPEIETVEAKLVMEVLDSIPRCYDAARAFYQEDIPPVFEVILPMTTSAEQLNRVYHYYKKWVV